MLVDEAKRHQLSDRPTFLLVALQQSVPSSAPRPGLGQGGHWRSWWMLSSLRPSCRLCMVHSVISSFRGRLRSMFCVPAIGQAVPIPFASQAVPIPFASLQCSATAAMYLPVIVWCGPSLVSCACAPSFVVHVAQLVLS